MDCEEFVLLPGPGKPGAYCPRCCRSLEIGEFLRTLTPAEALARGYANNVQNKIISTYCRKCSGPKPRPNSKLTAKEIEQRVSQGRLTPWKAQKLLAKKELHARVKQSVASGRRWDKTAKDLWRPVLWPLRSEIQRVRTYMGAVKARGNKHPDILEFHQTYLEVLCGLRERMHDAFLTKGARKSPGSQWWVHYLSEHERATLDHAWEGLGELRMELAKAWPQALNAGCEAAQQYEGRLVWNEEEMGPLILLALPRTTPMAQEKQADSPRAQLLAKAKAIQREERGDSVYERRREARDLAASRNWSKQRERAQEREASQRAFEKAFGDKVPFTRELEPGEDEMGNFRGTEYDPFQTSAAPARPKTREEEAAEDRAFKELVFGKGK